MNISNQFHTRRSLFKKCNIFESISHASSLFKNLVQKFSEKLSTNKSSAYLWEDI